MNNPGESIHVLHVDDGTDFAEMTATFVERENERLTVDTATSAIEGLDRLADEEFDCIVSDYDMPRMNGIEFLEAVRDEYPDLPFILYTGKGSEAVASDAISAGVTDYLQKESGTSQYTVLANRIQNSVERYHAESELADRETRLKLLFEQSPLGVIEWDESFHFARMNDAAEDILGYAEDELIGESWEVIVPESDRDEVAEAVSGLLDDEEGYHSVNENIRKDGEEVICEWHNRVVTDEDGDVVTIFSQFQDITERRRQRRRLNTLVDNVPGIVYRCANRQGWPMEQVRGEVKDLTGYPSSELEGAERIYGEQIVHPDEQEDVWNTVQEAVAEDEAFELTYRIRTRDGAIKWVWERGRAVDSTENDTEVLEGFITDITERERIRQELSEEREFIDQALNTLDDVFYVLDTDSNVERWNRRLSEVTGYSDDEIAEMRAVDFFPDAECSRITATIDETLDTGHSIVESELLTKDGDRIPYEFTGARLTDSEGTVMGLVGIGRDITARLQRERDLEQHIEQLEQFADIISHDLRSPLNVAEGRIELAMEECESEHLDGALNAINRGQGLVDELAKLAREGEDIGDVASVILEDVMEECWETVETAEAELVTETDQTVRADRSRLKQLLENLVRNAVAHGGGDVVVTVGEMDGGFYVEDDGPGIPEAEREQVFETGYSSREKGAGLGLAIVKQVVDAHGWEIRATEGETGGARFEITGVEPA